MRESPKLKKYRELSATLTCLDEGSPEEETLLEVMDVAWMNSRQRKLKL